MSRNRHPSLSGRISWTVIRSDAQHWTALNILICAVKAQCGESRCCGSGNKKQVNVDHFQVYYTEVRPGVEQWRKVREGGGMEGEQLGEEGETEKAGVSIQKSPSCPTTNNTGQAFIYERTRFLPTCSQCPSALAWLGKSREKPGMWGSGSVLQTQALNFLQTSSEAELGGRDEGRQTKARVPSSHSYLAAGCRARLHWQQQTVLVSRKNLITW